MRPADISIRAAFASAALTASVLFGQQPQPDAPAFVKVGDTVTAGQTLLIIEAMKTMNPVPAPKAGRVAAVLVSDGQAVEFGEPLVVIE